MGVTISMKLTQVALMPILLAIHSGLSAGESYTTNQPIQWLYTTTEHGSTSIQAIIESSGGDEIILGYVKFYKNEIELIRVKSRLRGKGIGSKLMIRALKQIKASGHKKAYWDATPLGMTGNCLPFYIKLGAKFTELPRRSAETLHRHYAGMELVFERDGDPEQNLKRFDEPTFYRMK